VKRRDRADYRDSAMMAEGETVSLAADDAHDGLRAAPGEKGSKAAMPD
jgi:hypothetical protein